MIALKQNADASMGLQGTNFDDGQFIPISFQYTTASPLTQYLGVFSRRMIVKAISCKPQTASTNAVTATFYSVPDATAVGSGTAVHTGTFNLQGTANTTQTLSLTAAACDIPSGSSVGVVISGALGASGNGTVTVWLAPA